MSGGLFPSAADTYLFLAVVILWLIAEQVGGRIIPAIRRHGERVQKKDYGSNLAIVGGVVLSIIISVEMETFGIAMLPSWVFFLGITLMLLGVVFRQWAIAVLGRFFSPVIGVQRDQVVVENGPYRFIRHPAYTGFLLTLTGLGLAFQSWGAAVAILAIVGLALGYRISVEEKMLTEELGKPYLEYMKRTKRLIPFVV